MTREEAARIIKECKEKGFKHTFYTLNEYHTALDMAIKALRKDIPEMAVKDYKHPRDGMGYTYHDWICPACGAFIAYEPEGEGKTLAGRCRKCGQLIGGTR